MFDYQLYGLNAGGYHLTNLILHIMSALLLFWLFNRMTGTIWRSAFIAGFFALHPLHVESVAWISERKDVLSAFFWMLTLCLYVYYTEKPIIRRYLLVLFFFVCALMSKPMVITLPVVMILLDYWPLGRFKSKKTNLILWQLKEKIPFFVLSAALVIITFYAPHSKSYVKDFPLGSRIANIPVSFVTYLEKTFWPHDLAVFYPFSDQLPVWQVLGAALLIIVISVAVIATVKRLPYLFVGWLWYVITLLPVIKIVQVGRDSMADRYHYLSSIGIAVMMAWGIPLLFTEDTRKKILLPAIAFLTIMSVLTWKQCGYWKNSVTLYSHTLQVTNDNALAHNNLGIALFAEGKVEEAIEHYNKAIRITPDYIYFYNNRGAAYAKLGQYQLAIDNYNQAIRLGPDDAGAYYNRGIACNDLGQYLQAIANFKSAIRLKPDFADAYNNLGTTYLKLGQYQQAIESCSQTIRLKPRDANGYYNRGFAYGKLGQHQREIEDYNQTILLKPDDYEAYNNRGAAYGKLGQHQLEIEDYNQAIRLKPNYVEAYNNRGFAYLLQGNNNLGCRDAQKACEMGTCKTLEWAKGKGFCR
jgi:tetratricopeptide (TPR) repeat protein